MFESLMIFLILTLKFESPILQEPPANACSILRTKSSTLRAKRQCPPNTTDTCSRAEPLPAQPASAFPDDAKAWKRESPILPEPLRQPCHQGERPRAAVEFVTEAPRQGRRSGRRSG